MGQMHEGLAKLSLALKTTMIFTKYSLWFSYRIVRLIQVMRPNETHKH